MGVNWQNNEYYRDLKAYEKETGFSVADQNRIANPYGSHSFGGLLISQVLPQLLMGGAEKLGTKLGGSSNTGSATDIKSSTDEKAKLNKILRGFDKAINKGDTVNIEKYYKDLQDLSTKNPGNTNYTKALELAKKKKENKDTKT